MRVVTSDSTTTLAQGWSWASSKAGTINEPGPALEALAFEKAVVPGTVAAQLRAAGSLDLSNPPNFDAHDYWFRCQLPASERAGRRVLVFEGLATLSEAWIGKRCVLRSDNMFCRHEVDVTDALLNEDPTLTLRFAALDPTLATRRPRPRWRTRLVDQQELRWQRTTLLGRTPGFCPRLAPVGPYRPIRLEVREHWSALRTTWRAVVEPQGRAHIELSLALEGSKLAMPLRAELELDGAAVSHTLPLDVASESSDVLLLCGKAELHDVALWWPHTHGQQPLSSARVRLRCGSADVGVELGRVGFRNLARAADSRGFGLCINGVPIFCRGACWSTDDLISLGATGSPRSTLELARRAGMNMLRIGGTMIYESDEFYDLCAELGILVWQDFMFANMDYPADDSAFLESVNREVSGLLSRLEAQPCLAVLCGGSEVEQQAAMLGLSPEQRESPLFHEVLPRLVREHAPGIPYLPSTPSGGALPFHANAEVSHYYGVGAYMRPLSDVRASSVQFAAECLALSNVPEEQTIDAFLAALETPPQHPKWKERVPRDRGVGWDFEDIRDHYLRVLFGVDPLALRYSDVSRYLALGRVASGELMERVFCEWRRPGSSSRGGLVWLLRDFWPGAGFGVIDALGTPKAAYYALARVFSPVALLITDEGLNGFALHAVNDGPDSIEARVRIGLFRDGHIAVGGGATDVTLPARAGVTLAVDALLEAFCDTTYSYRFGPPACDLVTAFLIRKKDDTVLGRAFGFPLGLPDRQHEDLGLVASFENEDGPTLHCSSRRFAQSIVVDVPGFRSDDNYFHLAPGEQRRVRLLGLARDAEPSEGRITALNSRASVRIARKPSD